MFENLKKRYSKKKNMFKKANQSGTSTALIEKAKKAYDEYQFLIWLDDHMAGRVTLSNVTQVSNESSVNPSDGSEAEDDPRGEELGEASNDEEEPCPAFEPAFEPSFELPVKQTCKRQSTAKSGTKRKQTKMDRDNLEMCLMKELSNECQNENKPSESVSKDADDLFGSTIATELKQLDPRRRCLVKNEIRNVLCRHQIESYDLQMNRHLQQSQDHFQQDILSPVGSSTSNMSYTDMLQS